MAVGCLASSVVWLAGATAARRPSGLAAAVDGATVRVLQLNLCDSGIAPCFTGRSVSAAAAVIRAARPDVVTLNEVCREDVSELKRAVSAINPNAFVASAFRAAADRPTHGPFRCRNGQQYGNGVLALVPSSAASGYGTYGGVYPTQDLRDPEERVWLCIHAPHQFYACSTHAASTSTTIALAQCRYFLGKAVPIMRARGGDDPLILGADLNLRADHSPDPRSCLPAGYHRVDDGARQDVVTSPGLTMRSRTLIDMQGTTDHPGLLVDFAGPR